MKIFIIGLPQSGRTTFAQGLCKKLQFSYFSWVQPIKFFSEARQDVRHMLTVDQTIVDGVMNPFEFVNMFNYNNDVVVFLNRTDAAQPSKDQDAVAINVMRDYCLWLATSNLLTKDRWLEFNYKIPGEESDFLKHLGKHNTVTITKSINKAIEHLTGELCKFLT